ncbi:CpsD/CapB family tyrosine-protein kinase [Weissella paramesenteroides]|uniref:CpsD/CapB family tyrosine-protein kinase n=1 Tax=Weissella paramesenteroides TaxID=1249 RepID=UPI00123C641D|nr:CpsD/CapB family tyrosine-protein kinase [Weissella paramesenteroides]KAA8453759.1 CpsD/CapB family tyrosine-protein kinase [Weissella paramesenteroides]KAA8457758.1 CpsD/CapB family tyrosine-protein kinase [Weissella paramesenteroides]KAA8460269.1 CpsD/CapB family tyrosine-protein kinase [Weissella paramesenteroides]KAA8460785.1 CpsD/CapB family tyrosine-protein kinase [Weissella paramesenteroides]KAA8461649.1 CpsD/CapB family tyrosine-protein kinase [Weissella paramesenteroides]
MGLFRKKDGNKDTRTQDKGAQLVTVIEPRNVISEQFRTLRTNIEFAGASLENLQVIMFTSAEISDGKTTVSTNTAVTWAQAGKSVLYVDADMRRSTAQSTFRLSNGHGLSTILASAEQPKDVVQKTFVENLEVLTAGPTPPNPAELLNSKRMASLIEWMRNNYDIVVLDVPPIMSVSDAQVLLPLIDGVVLVTMFNKTMKVSLKRTVEVLELGNTKILGIVERVKDNKDGAGYGYGYGQSE